MSGRDREVGWCQVICDTGEVYYLPRSEYDRFSAGVTDRMGWVSIEDVYGATRMFRWSDIQAIADCSPESLKLELLAEAEDE